MLRTSSPSRRSLTGWALPGWYSRTAGLEVLADEAGGGAGDAEDGAGIVVRAGVGLGVAKGLHAAEGGEEVKKANIGAIEGEVGDAVAPGAKFETRLLTQQVRFNAEIARAGDAAAEVVPGEAALEEPGAVALVAVDDAALVVLGEGAGAFLKNLGSGVAPADQVASCLVVGEEAAVDSGAVDGEAEVGDVVGEMVVGLGEGGLQDDGGELGGGRRVVGEDRRGEGDQRQEQTQEGGSKPDDLGALHSRGNWPWWQADR